MNNFKVGDIVEGNSSANIYGITKEGCVLEVTAILSETAFHGRLVDNSPKACDKGRIGVIYTLRSVHFNLKESVIQENE